MMREFKFEDDMHTTLACVPMAVRRKLDRVGVKVGLEQWKALGRGERLAICHLPVERHEEREALRLFINEAVLRVCGEEPRTLAEAQRAVADPPSKLPGESPSAPAQPACGWTRPRGSTWTPMSATR